MTTITLSDLREWRKRKAGAATIQDMKRVGREFQSQFDLHHLKGGDIFELLNDKPLTLGMLDKIDFRSQS